MVPSIYPLETLHNSLSLKQVDEFLTTVCEDVGDTHSRTLKCNCNVAKHPPPTHTHILHSKHTHTSYTPNTHTPPTHTDTHSTHTHTHTPHPSHTHTHTHTHTHRHTHIVP